MTRCTFLLTWLAQIQMVRAILRTTTLGTGRDQAGRLAEDVAGARGVAHGAEKFAGGSGEAPLLAFGTADREHGFVFRHDRERVLVLEALELGGHALGAV